MPFDEKNFLNWKKDTNQWRLKDWISYEYKAKFWKSGGLWNNQKNILAFKVKIQCKLE